MMSRGTKAMLEAIFTPPLACLPVTAESADSRSLSTAYTAINHLPSTFSKPHRSMELASKLHFIIESFHRRPSFEGMNQPYLV